MFLLQRLRWYSGYLGAGFLPATAPECVENEDDKDAVDGEEMHSCTVAALRHCDTPLLTPRQAVIDT